MITTGNPFPLHVLVEPDVIILHHTPVSPLESYFRRTTVHLQDLPSKRRHHSLEGLVTGREVRVLGAVVLVRRDDGIVSAHLEHVLGSLRWTAIDCKGVVLVVYGAPVGQARLEGGLDFPILDKVLDKLWKTTGFVVHFPA